LIALCVYLFWPHAEPKNVIAQPVQVGVPKPNSKIPVEVSYSAIGGYIAKNLSGVPYKRHIDIRLNFKVSEEALREIALELKARAEQQYEYDRVFFFLPGKGRDMGPGNTSPWAMADFDAGLRVTIMGFTIEEERRYRTAGLSLPAGSIPLGTWLMDDGFARTRITIYERQHRYFYHLQQWAGTDGRSWKEMEELPREIGRCFRMCESSDRYVALPNGDLELYDGEGKLLHHLPPIIPPPPTN
jgi:hypothetical protein